MVTYHMPWASRDRWRRPKKVGDGVVEAWQIHLLMCLRYLASGFLSHILYSEVAILGSVLSRF